MSLLSDIAVKPHDSSLMLLVTYHALLVLILLDMLDFL